MPHAGFPASFPSWMECLGVSDAHREEVVNKAGSNPQPTAWYKLSSRFCEYT